MGRTSSWDWAQCNWQGSLPVETGTCLVGGRDFLWKGFPVETATSSPSGGHFLCVVPPEWWWLVMSCLLGGRWTGSCSVSRLTELLHRAFGSSGGKVGGSWRPYASLPRFHTRGGGATRRVASLSLSLSRWRHAPEALPPTSPSAPPLPSPAHSPFLSFFSSPPPYSAFNVIIQAALAAVRDVG